MQDVRHVLHRPRIYWLAEKVMSVQEAEKDGLPTILKKRVHSRVSAIVKCSRIVSDEQGAYAFVHPQDVVLDKDFNQIWPTEPQVQKRKSAALSSVSRSFLRHLKQR